MPSDTERHSGSSSASEPEWDGTFTPAQQALHDEIEDNTERLLWAIFGKQEGDGDA